MVGGIDFNFSLGGGDLGEIMAYPV